MKPVESIAIVGIGCRLPGGVRSPDQFYSFLAANGDGVVPVPEDRWSTDRFSSEGDEVPGRSYVFHGAFLREDVFAFDPGPFGISPREAEYLDPQQRLLLEVSHDAIEDAGLAVSSLKGTGAGVYVGAFNIDARDAVAHPGNRLRMSPHTSTGASHTVLSNRISYTFDLHGPSFTVDTACSSSLVALHYACRDLLEGITDLALAGGVNVMLSPVSTAIMCKGHFLSPDGRSKAFDASADGYGRGEGAGIVVLKRLADAVRNGDRIYAVVLSSGVNQDGKTDGMPMPNGDAQAALCRRVIASSGVAPHRVGFVEAHGTGTRAGDPTEVRALASVYCPPERVVPLAIGSVKTNVGHLEAAAGITGVIKAALSLRARRILPLRALDRPSPDIAFDALKVRVPVHDEAWPEGADPVAAVNSFGYGGTNAHAVLRAPEAGELSTSGRLPGEATVAVLSAYDDAALRARANQLLSAESLATAAGVLAHRRDHLPIRAFAWGASEEELRESLRKVASGTPHPGVVTGKRLDAPRLLFVYTGMGPQWWAMGRELLEKDRQFRAFAEESDAAFREASGWSVIDELLRSEAESRMKSNAVAQPASFVLQYALTRLLRHHGVIADGYLGHSVGELTAAWASGCLDLASAARLAFHRSDIQQRIAGRGTMAALAVPFAEARELCSRYDDVSIAAINGALSVALAGGESQLDAIVAEVEASGRFARKMRVEVAYHSHQMEPLRDAFVERLADLRSARPAAPLYSTARGVRVSEACHDAQYWWENARNPVLLHDALKHAFEDGYDVVVEVGPHPVLGEAIVAAARERSKSIVLLSAQRRNLGAVAAFRACLGGLYTSGLSPDLSRLVPDDGASVALPYPFQRKRYWFEDTPGLEYRLGRAGAHPLLDQKVPGSPARWHVELAGQRFAWTADHRVQRAVVFPGAGYIEAALAVFAETFGDGDELIVEKLELESPVVFSGDEPPTLELSLEGADFVVASRAGTTVTTNARAHISGRSRFAPCPPRTALPEGLVEKSVDELYADFEARGLSYGPTFRLLRRVQLGAGIVVAEVTVPEGASRDYWIFPGALDAAFQALLALLPAALKGAVVPVGARVVRCFRRAEGRLTAIGEARLIDGAFVCDLVLYDEAGAPVLSVESLVCRSVSRGADERARASLLYVQGFQPVPKASRAGGPLTFAVLGKDNDAVHTLQAEIAARGHVAVTSLLAPPAGLLHVVMLAATEPGDPTGECELNHLACLVRGLARRDDSRLTVVTRGAYAASDTDVPVPASAALVGFARVVMTEHPALDARVVDVTAGAPSSLADLLESSWEEEECALRGETILALRHHRPPPREDARGAERRAPELGEMFELASERPGRLDSLCYRTRRFSRELGDTQVELQVRCASLNFKDVMKAMGMLDETALHRTYLGKELGLDAAGVVVKVGAKVSAFRPGDSVVVFAGGCLASHVRVDEKFVVRVARGHTFAEACTYLVFQTVWYGLFQRAQLARGEKILIHSAAGGVGLSAIQAARHAGAEIFATAGTRQKREALRAMGIEHVYDSRTLDYSREVLRDTGGRGVDVVLSSLAGEALLHNIDVLAPGGRLVELGKQDISKSLKLSLQPFNRAIGFIAIDMDRMATESPDYFAPVARAVCDAFEQGVFTPLPAEIYPASDAVAAFRKLASGTVVGKLVLDFSGGVKELAPGSAPASLFDPAKTYLVVGGLGGFGLRTAQWLVDRGARHIVLASRRGTPAAQDAASVAQLSRDTTTTIEARALDVTDREAVSRIISELARRPAPLGGVIHSAMVLDDRPIIDLEPESIASVLRPKALGAWNLHLATRELSLDHFVVYSSVSAIVGNPGQSAYAAANAFLDGLVAHRTKLGLAATTVRWGALAEVGVVARDRQVETHLRAVGLTPLSPDVALDQLGEILEQGLSEASVIDIDWMRWMRTTPDTRWHRLERLREAASDPAGQSSLFATLLESITEPERGDFVTRKLAALLAPIFKMSDESLDTSRSLKDFGMDSLMAVEVQAAIEELTAVEISTMELLAGRSTHALGQLIAKRVLERASTAEKAHGTAPQALPAGDLTAYFLERICVQRPYFALEDIQSAGDWLSALVRPVPPHPRELAVVSLAESARHTAILGSCAARLMDARAGRIYYPVRGARLLRHDPDRMTPLGHAAVRARCREYDTKSSLAVAEVELAGRDGRLVSAFEVTYHVIPEAEFVAMFTDRRARTDEASGEDPYAAWSELPQLSVEGATYKFRFGPVPAGRCLGHFVGFPAYPVSMMARDATLAVAEATSHMFGLAEARVRIVGGTAGTTRFAFAGDELELSVTHVEGSHHEQLWRAAFTCNGQDCAWFDMKVEISEVPAPPVEGQT